MSQAPCPRLDFRHSSSEGASAGCWSPNLGLGARDIALGNLVLPMDRLSLLSFSSLAIVLYHEELSLWVGSIFFIFTNDYNFYTDTKKAQTVRFELFDLKED